VIAFGKDYLSDFPKEVRLLSGSMDGALAAQQTAAIAVRMNATNQAPLFYC
jgi:hypothetical protein